MATFVTGGGGVVGTGSAAGVCPAAIGGPSQSGARFSSVWRWWRYGELEAGWSGTPDPSLSTHLCCSQRWRSGRLCAWQSSSADSWTGCTDHGEPLLVSEVEATFKQPDRVITNFGAVLFVVFLYGCADTVSWV